MAGESGRIVWQVGDGKVTDGAADRGMPAASERVADAPGAASGSAAGPPCAGPA
ncbi:hypothetical protein ACWD0Z_03630 [Streptomyces sp. NPDC003007]